MFRHLAPPVIHLWQPTGQRQHPGGPDQPLAAHPLRLFLAVERVGPHERHPDGIDGRRRSNVVPRLRPGNSM
jgi:hypothetical protein